MKVLIINYLNKKKHIYNKKMFGLRSTKMIIFDMAGTTIQEKGIVYNSLFNTIKLIKPDLLRSDISRFAGYNKNEVIKYYIDQQRMNSPDVVLRNLKSGRLALSTGVGTVIIKISEFSSIE